MKKILYIVVAIFAFVLASNSISAQTNVYFTGEKINTDRDKLTAQVYSNKAQTVTFKLTTSKNAAYSYGAAGYKVIDYNNYISCYVTSSTSVVNYLTVNLPQGYSPVEINLTNKVIAVMEVQTVNGASYSTRPIVFNGNY